MKKEKDKTRLLSLIRPGYIIAVTLVIALVMVISAVFELSQSKKELYRLMTEEATSLIETINMSSRNTVLSNDEIEELITQRLLSAARMTAYIDSIRHLTQQELEMIARENEVFRINVFDKNGKKVASSYIPDSSHLNIPSKHEPKDFFEPILRGETNEIIIGLKEARHEEGRRFAVAVSRKSNRGGAVVVNVDAAYILEFRKKIGFGKMIQDIGDNKGLEYIVLQDENGIIAASKNISEMIPIDEDSFLREAYQRDSVFTRINDFQGKEVFEVVKPFFVEGEKFGMFRLGISMEQMQALESRMARRGIILTIVLFVIAAIAVSGILVSQNLKVVKKEFEKIQTYTGNILQSMADSIITTDRNGSITIFNKNAETVFGVSEKDVLGKSVFDVVGGKFQFLREVLRDKIKIDNTEIVFDSKDGSNKILSLSTAFTFSGSGDIEAFTIVIRDITELRGMEKHVQQQEKMAAMGELASGVAHEIRNPLNAISMIAQRYDKEFKPKDNVKEYKSLTKVLLTETKRVNNIIQQFLRFARPPKLNLSSVSSSELLEGLSGVVEVQCKSKGIGFRIDAKAQKDLRIDVELMKQALLNILRNAIDATSKGGEVTLLFYTGGKKDKFEITDTGNGIPEEQIGKIFNLYYTTKTEGTGVGLSIVQQIISQHNGEIKVESKVGKGTKFTIELPVNT